MNSPRYPFDALARKMGVSPNQAGKQLGLSGSTLQDMQRRGLSDDQCERWALRAGFHPFEVWPELIDDRIADAGRECAAPGCDEVFEPANGKQRYCSTDCQRRTWQRARYWARRSHMTERQAS